MIGGGIAVNDADDVLKHSYQLVVLEQVGDGRLELSTLGLFFNGARRGDRKRFRIRCGPSSAQHGTAFVVVESARPLDFTILSVHSAHVPLDTYNLTAELAGPAEVIIRGLPSPLSYDPRSWDEILEEVPDRVERLEPTHLIVAIEFSGDPDDVQDRLDRAAWLIKRVEEGAEGKLRVSLLTYGPHKFSRHEKEQSPRMLTWAEDSDAALSELALLSAPEQEWPSLGYSRAAQLECLLTMLAGRVQPADGRCVLVTIGSRPASPARVDPESEIFPCPRRHDWREAVSTLADAGVTFGAIRDHGDDEEIWSHLGRTVFARLSTVDLGGFAAALGLIADTGHAIPLPLALTEGA
jgi:hypothetical protein